MRKVSLFFIFSLIALSSFSGTVSARETCDNPGGKETQSCTAKNGCNGTRTRTCNKVYGQDFGTWGSWGSCNQTGKNCGNTPKPPACVAPLSLCGTTCVNKLTSSNNCGICGKVCTKTAKGVSTVCFQGNCVENVAADNADTNAPVKCPGITWESCSSTNLGQGKGQPVTEGSNKSSYCNAQGMRCSYYRRECKFPMGKSYQWCAIDTQENCTKDSSCNPKESTAPNPSPSFLSTPKPSPMAACLNVLPYKKDFTNVSSAELATFKTGDQIYFCALGTGNIGEFTKAQFTINGTVRAETTVKKTGTQYFCDLYTIPAGTYDYTVTAKVYNSVLGWK